MLCHDFATDLRMGPWRNGRCVWAIASAAFPLVAAGMVRGVFTLYAGVPEFFNDEEVRLLDGLAADISLLLSAAEARERPPTGRSATPAQRGAILQHFFLRQPAGDWDWLL